MIDVTTSRSRATALLLAIGSALVAALACGIASGSALSILPAALLVRFVWADYEGSMTLALMMMGGLSLVALATGPAACLFALAGAFVAAELAALGAQIQRTGSDAGVRRRLLEVAGNMLFGLATMGFGAVLTIADPPAWVGTWALAIVSLGAGATWMFMSSHPTHPAQPTETSLDHPQGADQGDSGRTGR